MKKIRFVDSNSALVGETIVKNEKEIMDSRSIKMGGDIYNYLRQTPSGALVFMKISSDIKPVNIAASKVWRPI